MSNQHQPIQPEHEALMNALAGAIDETLNAAGEKKNAFVLLVFPFGDNPNRRANYISNARREDIIATLKEFIARSERRYVEEVAGIAEGRHS